MLVVPKVSQQAAHCDNFRSVINRFFACWMEPTLIPVAGLYRDLPHIELLPKDPSSNSFSRETSTLAGRRRPVRGGEVMRAFEARH
jgi:hypothetical protein